MSSRSAETSWPVQVICRQRLSHLGDRSKVRGTSGNVQCVQCDEIIEPITDLGRWRRRNAELSGKDEPYTRTGDRA